MANRVRDLTGRTFGRLTGIVRVGSDPHGTATWEFLCECGTRVTRTGTEVTRGKTLSCGCLRRDIAPVMNATHGEWGCAEWQTWSSMRARCENVSHKAYANYGGRGIMVCERWSSYENFLADMGRRPSPAHSLDRINNGLGYTPDNCRWASRSVQSRNRRTNVLIEHNGESLCLAEWGERLGLTGEAIRRRLRDGWSVADAVTRPRAYALSSGSPLPK